MTPPQKVKDIPGCQGCPMQEIDYTYEHDGRRVRHLGLEQTFVPPRIGREVSDPARLVLAEAPGETEAQLGEPLVGGSGQFFDSLCSKAGVRREGLVLANTIWCRPPANIYPGDPDSRAYISREGALGATSQCFRNHILPLLQTRKWSRVDALGDKALKTLTGLTGIYKWRGSILESEHVPGAKVVPTLHPAALMREQTFIPVVISDLKKSLVPPPERYNLYPSPSEFESWIENKLEFCFDIETNRFTQEVYMVGLASRPFEVVVVPFEGPYIQLLKRLFANCLSVIGQNLVQFDLDVLEKNGVVLNCDAEIWDIMLMHHLVQPDLPHDLEFIGSVFCNKPAWKHLEKEDKKLYCARDTDVTIQIYPQLKALLKQQELLDVYKEISLPTAKLSLLLRKLGVKTDPTRIQEVRERLLKDSAALEQALPECLKSTTVACRKRILAPPEYRNAAGRHTKYMLVESSKSITPWRSDKSVSAWLHGGVNSGGLGLPVQYHIKTKRPTTDKTALDKLYRISGNAAIQAIRKLRAIDETLTTFAKEKMIYGQSMHTNFNVHGTNSGRLSSSEPNLQNIPEASRCIYIPHYSGWKIIQFDYSQIENRLTAYLANDTERLLRFQQDPNFSEHKWAASIFFNIPYEDVIKDNDKEAPYGKAKRIVHGCHSWNTEILTPSGWVKIADYKSGPIAEWNPQSRIISFKEPKAFVAKYDEGTLLKFEGRGFGACVTHNHDFPYETATGHIRKIQAHALDGESNRIPVAGQFEFGADSETDVRLAVAIQADATLIGNHAVFHFHKPRKAAQLEALLGERPYVKEPCSCGKGFTYRVPAEVVKTCTKILTDKSFNANVLELTQAQAQKLIDEIPFWDGERGGKSGRQKSFITTDKQSAIWVQTLYHLLGKQALLRFVPFSEGHYGKKEVWKLSFNRRTKARKFTRQEVNYQGKVYCFETTSGFFLIRYNGTISISGNTNYGMGAKKIHNLYDIEEKEVKKLQAAWKGAILRTSQWQERVAAEAKKEGVLVNAFGRKRWFYTKSYYTEALSFLPQSTAADILLRAMLALMYERISWPLERVQRVADIVLPLPKPANLLLTVHDSLVFEAPSQLVDDIVETVVKVMTQPWRQLGGFSCPVSIEVGDSWGELEKYRYLFSSSGAPQDPQPLALPASPSSITITSSSNAAIEQDAH